MNPNSFAYYRLGEPLPTLVGAGNTTGFAYFRLAEPFPGLLTVSGGERATAISSLALTGGAEGSLAIANAAEGALTSVVDAQPSEE